MEVTTINKTGISKIGDNVTIRYSITCTGENTPNGLTANIYRNEVLCGFFNMAKNGVTGFSLQENNGLTDVEIKQIFQQAIDDAVAALS